MRTLSLLSIVLCAGCATSGVDRSVIDLVRSTRAGGSCHIEFDANGKFMEAGAETLPDSVPGRCRTAADAAFPGGKVTGASRVKVDGRVDWMVVKTIDGRAIEILVSDDGTVRGGEEVLRKNEWPEKVVAAAQAQAPGASLERVERVWGDEAVGAERFHVKLNDKGDSVRVGLTEDADVVRVVRRVAAQIRVPR